MSGRDRDVPRWWESAALYGELCAALLWLNRSRALGGEPRLVAARRCVGAIRALHAAATELDPRPPLPHDRIVDALGRRSGGAGLLDALEPAVDRLLDHPSRRLAVYGTLSPGREHHGVVGGIRGRWMRAAVRGVVDEHGWGRTGGYPALRWDPCAPLQPVWLLVSPELHIHWARIDRFEGEPYVRVLVPIELADARRVVANVYVV